MTPGTVFGNVQVVAPFLRLVGAAAVCPDPVAMLALPSHKNSLALFLLLLDLCFVCSSVVMFTKYLQKLKELTMILRPPDQALSVRSSKPLTALHATGHGHEASRQNLLCVLGLEPVITGSEHFAKLT